ncbi:MAG: CDP-diacylglycerol--glycerol-3-phosphate 3-phosphatidyltransferase [Desulfobacterales bacterium]|nr:CDP-diacylglycerol--glycerol-3-phosphate 3-phosphatidyltransferase [Desulfobacterales bacterium]
MKNRLPISIPNILTIIRILLTPIFVICLLKDVFFSGFVIFIFAAITDGLDGFIARYFNQRTVLGAYLDPIADKMLLMSAFITLSVLKIIPSWLTVIVLSRDVVIVLGVAIIAIVEIKVEIKPSIISKLTTLFQLVTVSIMLCEEEFHFSSFSYIEFPLFAITGVLTVLSGLHYIYRGMNILQNSS